MKAGARPGRRRQQPGFSLVELMVALTLGLLVIGAAGSVYLSAKRAYDERDGIASVQENARSVLLIVDAAIRNAGYRSNPQQQIDPVTYFSGNQIAIAGGDAQNLHGVYGLTTAVVAGSDYVAASVLGNDDGATTTCLGSTVLAGQIGTSIFFAGKAAGDNVASLYCASTIVTADVPHAVIKPVAAQPLLLGLENLAVLYGIDTDGDGAVDRYLDAASVATANAWTDVGSVQLDFTLQAPAVTDPLAPDGAHITGGRLQALLSRTIALRNPLTR